VGSGGEEGGGRHPQDGDGSTHQRKKKKGMCASKACARYVKEFGIKRREIVGVGDEKVHRGNGKTTMTRIGD